MKRIVHRGVRDDGRPETPAQHRRRAEAKLAELQALASQPESMRERWTVGTYARKRYLPSLTESRKPLTVEGYAQLLDAYVFPYVGHIELSNLTPDDVDKLDADLRARGMSTATRRHARGVLGRVLRHAVRKTRLDRDVTQYADRLPVEQADRTQGTLEPEQVRALLSAASDTEWERRSR